MKSKLTTMTIILVLIASTIYAQNIPQKISFQGRLLDAATQKPVTAEKSFTFKIRDWIEEHKNILNSFCILFQGKLLWLDFHCNIIQHQKIA